jgi:hypothetical protein
LHGWSPQAGTVDCADGAEKIREEIRGGKRRAGSLGSTPDSWISSAPPVQPSENLKNQATT